MLFKVIWFNKNKTKTSTISSQTDILLMRIRIGTWQYWFSEWIKYLFLKLINPFTIKNLVGDRKLLEEKG
jgi:hypothetical protein